MRSKKIHIQKCFFLHFSEAYSIWFIWKFICKKKPKTFHLGLEINENWWCALDWQGLKISTDVLHKWAQNNDCCSHYICYTDSFPAQHVVLAMQILKNMVLEFSEKSMKIYLCFISAFSGESGWNNNPLSATLYSSFFVPHLQMRGRLKK